ncbi:cytochrome b5 domain-containing protein 1 isoform X2 [Ictalurus furcatus]|uniref:cytochrome b5 domain-containing protein 1 isoform X2 n=1 Tax=Ictalurus furcatus TaxID=66913 RepID=UPI00234FF94C|nr:cytochrome b5 domain-containing protein 1 isoform X2 [Ictalurus furcatus]
MPRPKYFTPNEVSVHNSIGDLWVSYLGKVYNLTPLLQEYKGDVLLKPIIESAGKDISHWFDPKMKDIITHVDPLTGCVKYYTPRGRFLHVPPICPCTDWANDFGKPWWKDMRYEVGILTAKARWIRIINTLSAQEQRLESCFENTESLPPSTLAPLLLSVSTVTLYSMQKLKEIPEMMRKKMIEIHQSGKGYKAISKALGFQRTTARAIIS